MFRRSHTHASINSRRLLPSPAVSQCLQPSKFTFQPPSLGSLLNERTHKGESPLILAARDGHADVVSQLIRRGASLAMALDRPGVEALRSREVLHVLCKAFPDELREYRRGRGSAMGMGVGMGMGVAGGSNQTASAISRSGSGSMAGGAISRSGSSGGVNGVGGVGGVGSTSPNGLLQQVNLGRGDLASPTPSSSDAKLGNKMIAAARSGDVTELQRIINKRRDRATAPSARTPPRPALGRGSSGEGSRGAGGGGGGGGSSGGGGGGGDGGSGSGGEAGVERSEEKEVAADPLIDYIESRGNGWSPLMEAASLNHLVSEGGRNVVNHHPPPTTCDPLPTTITHNPKYPPLPTTTSTPHHPPLTTQTHAPTLQDACKYLVEHGCQLELRNKKGFTALMLACRDGALPVVTFLVEQGADTDVVVPRLVVGECAATASYYFLLVPTCLRLASRRSTYPPRHTPPPSPAVSHLIQPVQVYSHYLIN